MTYGTCEASILNTFEKFTLEEINQGINELESNIGRTYFGNPFKEKLKILYILREQKEKRVAMNEIPCLKKALIREFMKTCDYRTAEGKMFQIWVEYQNELKGALFVRDGLKSELEKIQAMVVVK